MLVEPTDGLVGPVERFQYCGEDPAGTCDAYTTAYTGKAGVGVTASSLVQSALGLTLSGPSVSGKSGQAVHVRVGSLL